MILPNFGKKRIQIVRILKFGVGKLGVLDFCNLFF